MSLVVEKGFRPVIYHHAGDRGKQFLDAWGVIREGQPVGATPPLKAAVWHGTRYNNRGETIAIVASVHRKSNLDITRANYFFGLATRDTVEAVPEVERAEVFADTATMAVIGIDPQDTPLHFLLHKLSTYAPPPTES